MQSAALNPEGATSKRRKRSLESSDIVQTPLNITADQTSQLITLLEDLSTGANNRDKKRVNDLIHSIVKDPGPKQLDERLGEVGLDEKSPGGELHASGAAGSNENVDVIDEDIFRSNESKATGFVGHNSEVQWLRSLRNQVRRRSDTAIPNTQSSKARGASASLPAPMLNASSTNHEPPTRGDTLRSSPNTAEEADIQHVTNSSFYLDHDNINADIEVDEYELPSPKTAERLFECYVTTVHASFPIVPQDFEEDFKHYLSSIKQQHQLQFSRKRRAILNLIFAIAAYHARLVNAEWLSGDVDHCVFMARALRLLELNNTLLVISAPDLALIQATGLLSMYFLIIGHINRAWVTIGLSLRSALAVGLHLKNEDETASSDRKEMLVRTWWGLHAIECLVSAATGRPCVITAEDCTVPFPRVRVPNHNRSSSVPHSPVSSTRGPNRAGVDSLRGVSIFEAHIRLRLITQRGIELLYTPRAVKVSWEQTQKNIATLMNQLEDWSLASFPEGLALADFDVNSTSAHGFTPQYEHLLLAFSLFSTQLLITRPCLCRLEERIRGQSKISVNFDQKIARTCIQAALDVCMLLPDTPDPLWVYYNGPWWCIVHNIMQALTVFLLEMSYGGANTEPNSSQISQSVGKLIVWLSSMRHNDAVAERAYKVTFSILKSAPHLPSDIINVLEEDEEGSNVNQMELNQLNPSSLDTYWRIPEFLGNPQPQFSGEQHQFVADDLFSDPSSSSEQSKMQAQSLDPFMARFNQMYPLGGGKEGSSLTTDEIEYFREGKGFEPRKSR